MSVTTATAAATGALAASSRRRWAVVGAIIATQGLVAPESADRGGGSEGKRLKGGSLDDNGDGDERRGGDGGAQGRGERVQVAAPLVDEPAVKEPQHNAVFVLAAQRSSLYRPSSCSIVLSTTQQCRRPALLPSSPSVVVTWHSILDSIIFH